MSLRPVLATLIFCALSLVGAQARAFQAAIIYDIGGKFDKSFNQAAYEGAERFTREFGDRCRDFEMVEESQNREVLNRFASKGYDLIVLTGFSFSKALLKIAPQYPHTKFVIIDRVVNLPNVQSIMFKDHEGSFLVGMLAAMKTTSGVIGFIGGQDVPLIRRFALGYSEGAHHVNKNIKILEDTIGSTAEAWGNPGRAGDLARKQFHQSADVVFAAAGASGLGVIQAAAAQKRLAIGVDSNQNYIHPGTVLTSMIKRVDTAVYETLRDAREGTWKPGVRNLGLAEGGVDYALDKYNKSLITEEMRARVEAAKQDIISGKIVVTDYYDLMHR